MPPYNKDDKNSKKGNDVLNKIESSITPVEYRTTALSMYLAQRILDILTEKMLPKNLIYMLLGNNSVLTGSYNFTLEDIAKIEVALGVPLIDTEIKTGN